MDARAVAPSPNRGAMRRHTRASAKQRQQAGQSENVTPVCWADSKGATAAGKVSVALKSGLEQHAHGSAPQVKPSGCAAGKPEDPELTGLWASLPDEVLEIILRQCSPQQLGMLESSCRYFRRSMLIERTARHRLKAVPRARGLKPSKKDGDRWLVLLHFVTCQSNAAAQATAVAFGAYHTAALLVKTAEAERSEASVQLHSLYTFGRGFHGQLGHGTFDNALAPRMLSLGYRPCLDREDVEEETMPAVVACGHSHSASISRRGELFTWGMGGCGELGHAGWTPLEVPVPKASIASGVRIVSVTAGAHHTLAIAENGSLWTCGAGKSGQLGHGTLNDELRLACVASLKGVRIVSAAAGVGHSMALASDGSLYSWGDGRYGQLGHTQLQQLSEMLPNQAVVIPAPQKITRLDPNLLQPADRVTAIAAAGQHSAALTVGGNVLMYGKGQYGALGTGDQENRWKPTRVAIADDKEEHRAIRAVQVVCGSAHTLVLVSNGGGLEVRAAGRNQWGQLGLGDRKDRLRFTLIPQLAGIIAVQAGDSHSGAVGSNGELFLWGRGDCGQLGNEDERGKYRPMVLEGYTVVHPDKTLRRSKRANPNTRPIHNAAKRARLTYHQ